MASADTRTDVELLTAAAYRVAVLQKVETGMKSRMSPESANDDGRAGRPSEIAHVLEPTWSFAAGE